jgi:hypothetical protein
MSGRMGHDVKNERGLHVNYAEINTITIIINISNAPSSSQCLLSSESPPYGDNGSHGSCATEASCAEEPLTCGLMVNIWTSSLIRSMKPRTENNGVLISCDMLARRLRAYENELCMQWGEGKDGSVTIMRGWREDDVT